MPPKTVVLVGATCLIAGWILASALTPPVASVQVLPQPRAAQQNAPADEAFETAYAEQLRWRLQQAPAPPVPRRNPFVFGERARVEQDAPPRRAGGEPRNDAPVSIPVPVAVGPIYSLAGMATTATPQGAVRTAILSDGQGVHLVKEGDEIGGYKVIELTEISALIEDRSGKQFTLRLTQ